MIKLVTPLNREKIKQLKIGDKVLLSGVVYTARDRAIKKLITLIERKKKLPLSLENQIIYYCGPNIKGKKLGSCGPTTSSRMDDSLEELLKNSVLATIGKGQRAPWIRELLKKYKGIYFITYGGCGAYLRKRVTDFKLIAFSNLGAEAIYQLTLEDFPLIVGIDCQGRDIYQRLERSGDVKV
ncbi:MAG: fumarate hydratase C-terminal domain-containing protein [Candidatus Omnitrophica bacterium]|nr:fumarate hydratase C-terminal domain-containing protein [Candidatus Omnitrophota bacterium]